MTYDYVRLKPSEQIGMHSQPGWELSLIVKGHGERIVGDTVKAFKEGDMVLVIPNMPHQWRFKDTDGNIENVTITFTESFVGDVCARIPGFEPVVKYLSELKKSLEITDKTRALIAKKMLEMKDLSEVEKIAEFLGILATLSETTDNLTAGSFTKERSAEEKIKEVEIYVKCNYGRHISTNEVARHVGMSESGFCAFWKRRTGEKFTSYLTSRRITIARYLLKNKDLTVSEVAYETGFADLPSFSKAFKRLEGISPKKYRRSPD